MSFGSLNIGQFSEGELNPGKKIPVKAIEDIPSETPPIPQKKDGPFDDEEEINPPEITGNPDENIKPAQELDELKVDKPQPSEPEKEDFLDNFLKENYLEGAAVPEVEIKTDGPELETPMMTPSEKIETGNIYTSVEKNFNIKEEDLEKLEGFANLSEGQKALVLENFSQFVLGRVKEEANERTEASKNEKGFWGRAWQNVFNKYYSAREEKATMKEFQEGGIEIHRSALENIIKQTKESGLGAELVDGKLSILWAGSPEGLSEQQAEIVKNFNEAADKLSKIPQEWSEPNAESGNKKKYEEAMETFIEAKYELYNFKKVTEVREIEYKIQVNRYLSANPEIEKALLEINDQKVWWRAFKNIFVERGSYMALGFVVRTATVSVLGLLAAPLTAAAMGGYITRKRAVDELRKKEFESRRKDNEIKEENEQQKENRKFLRELWDKNFKIDESYKGKLDELQNKLDNTPDDEETSTIMQEIEKVQEKILLEKKPIKLQIEKLETKSNNLSRDFVDAEQTTKKLEELINKTKESLLYDDKAGKDKLERDYLERLKTRLDFTHKKLDDGLFDFGSGEERINRQIELLNKLSEAETLIASNNPKVNTELKERLDKFLDFREEKISEAQRKHLQWQLAKGALLGAGFAIGGYAIRHFLGEIFNPNSAVVGGKGEVNPDSLSAENSINTTSAKGGTLSPEDSLGKKGIVIPEQEIPKTGGTAQLEQEMKQRINDINDLATIKKGEGVWNPVRRQFEYLINKRDPETLNSLKLKAEDLSDGRKVTAAINKATYNFLVKNRYIDPDNVEEIRVSAKGIGETILIDQKFGSADIYDKTYGWHPEAEKGISVGHEFRNFVEPYTESDVKMSEVVPQEPYSAEVSPLVKQPTPTRYWVNEQEGYFKNVLKDLNGNGTKDFKNSLLELQSEKIGSLSSLRNAISRYEDYLADQKATFNSLSKINKIREELVSDLKKKVYNLESIFAKSTRIYEETIKKTGLSLEEYKKTMLPTGLRSQPTVKSLLDLYKNDKNSINPKLIKLAEFLAKNIGKRDKSISINRFIEEYVAKKSK